MKIAASTPNGEMYPTTEDGVDLTDLPDGEVVPAWVFTMSGDGSPALRATQDVRNIIARNPYFEEPVDADFEGLRDLDRLQDVVALSPTSNGELVDEGGVNPG